jgi:gag-polypeptide of LTR copia-type
MSNSQALESWQLDPISFEPKLDYDNYPLWSFKIKVILESRGLWHLVDGTEIAPTDQTALKHWKMRDACARLQLMANIPDKWMWIFMPATSTNEAWIALQEHFKPDSQFKRSLLMRKFTSANLPEGGDVLSHVQRMGELWQDVLASKAYTFEDGDLFFVAALLDSLPPSWSVFVTAWKVTAEESKVTPAILIGHILDLDAWNRGRADAHGWRAAGMGEQPKRRAKKAVGS